MSTLSWKIPIAVAVVAVCIVTIYTISQPEEEEKEKEKIKEKSATRIQINDEKIDKNRLMSSQKKANQNQFGQRQSPINIISKSDLNEPKLKDIEDDDFHSNPIKILYPKEVKDCTIINNGHTVQINIPKHNDCTLRVHGKTYLLKQFHFHIPSEHRVDGEQYEMEMHLVHINENGEIAVLGMIFTKKQKHFVANLSKSKSGMHVTLQNSKNNRKNSKNNGKNSKNDEKKNDFLTVTVDDDDIDTDSDWSDDDEKGDDKEIGNEFLDQFWEQLPTEKTEKDISLKKCISFDYLFAASASTGKFSKAVETNEIIVDMELFEYIGSLTTPPYTEGVQWLVLKKLHHINQKELNELSACWGNKNNARSLQDMHGRMVSLRSKASVTKLTD